MTFVSGQVPTAAELNAEILTPFSLGIGAYTAFTPTWSGSIGNGNLTGLYTKVGRTVLYEISCLMGSTTTYGVGAWTFTVPVTAANAGRPAGTATMYDSSAGFARYMRHAFLNTTGVIALQAEAPGTFLQATVPFTWATSDLLVISGHYQAAA